MARRGDTGPVVAEVRDRLIRLGLLPATAPAQFDAAMDAAVRAFQQQQGLNVDGIVGPET
ncbi:MAG: peptidoglycan-binding protein, partial [Actinobacteria bacterium]